MILILELYTLFKVFLKSLLTKPVETKSALVYPWVIQDGSHIKSYHKSFNSAFTEWENKKYRYNLSIKITNHPEFKVPMFKNV